ALADDWSPRRIEDADVELGLADNRVRAQGALGLSGDRLALDATLAEPGLIEPRLEGKATLAGELTGTFDALRAKLVLTGERLAFTGQAAQAEAAQAIRLRSLRVDADVPVTASLAPDAPLALTVRLRSAQFPGRELESLDL